VTKQPLSERGCGIYGPALQCGGLGDKGGGGG